MVEKTPGRNRKDKIIYLQVPADKSKNNGSDEDKKLDGYMGDLETIISQVRNIADKHGYDARTVLTDSIYRLVELEIVDYCEK